MSNNSSLFDLVVGLFKKKPKPVVQQPTYEELAAEAKWLNIKAQYRLEKLTEHNAWFVQYRHKSGEWWYLRRWTEDYTLERARGNAIRVSDENQFDQVIRMHQEWLAGGHIFMSFD
jgi:hypothetical protein